MIQPPKLNQNDKAIIVSPAGKIDSSVVYGATSILKEWGLDPIISNHALNNVGRFSGTIEQRLSDLQNALDDSDIKLILCSRGGYGAIHLLDKLDYTKLRQNPKWIIGYSDITALHSAILSNGVMAIHGPMAKHFSEEGPTDPSVKYTQSILFGENINYQFNVEGIHNINKEGVAHGPLFGGNLAVLCGLMGTKFLYVPQNGILFIEDIGESPYKLDRFINQLKLSGIFEKISGLIIGHFSECEEDSNMYAPLHETIANTLYEYSFPICFNFPVGHVVNNYPLIVGKEATLRVNSNHIIFKQIL